MKPYFAMGRRRRKMSRGKRIFFTLTVIIILAVWLALFVANRVILPVVTTIASQRAVAFVNETINRSLNDTIAAFELVSEDFFTVSVDNHGQLNSLSVNTILVNQVAALLAEDISRALSAYAPKTVRIPLGLATGIPIFAGLGPSFSVNILPMGETTVDHDSSFTSAGINQINFQVWLTIETTMRIVVPLQEDEVPVNRRVPLVNTVFAGEVPAGMILTDIIGGQ